MNDDDKLRPAQESPQPVRAGAESDPQAHEQTVTPLDSRLALLDRTDFGNAQRLLARFGDDLFFVHGVGYLAWDGTRWRTDQSDLAIRRFAHQTADRIREETTALRQEDSGREDWRGHFKWEKASQNSSRIEAMIREAKPYIERSVDAFDVNDFLFNAANRTLDLGQPPEHWEPDIEGPYIEPRKPHRDDLITLRAHAKYNPEALCPHWDRFLAEIAPDPAIREFLQRWSGYLLTGSGEEQVLVICYGLGANGKSTFMETIAHVLGEYAVGLPFASLLHNDRKRGSEATPDIARLRGARLVVTSEPDIGARFSESTIKQLTGGDRVTARDLHKGFFEFKPSFKLMLSVNNRPQVRGQDEGIWRRLLMVPFERVIPAGRRDRRLPDKLRLETSGILNWMILGYCKWRAGGLAVPDQVNEATRDYRESEDPVGSFLSSETQVEPNASVRASHLYKAYQRWCQENGDTAYSQKGFGRIITERGIPRSKSGVYFYRGIELVRPVDDSDHPTNTTTPE